MAEIESGKLPFAVRVMNAYQAELGGERDALVEAGRVLEKKVLLSMGQKGVRWPEEGCI